MKFKLFFILITLILLLQSCTNNCKDVNGDFSQFYTSLRYTQLTTYRFSGSSVKLMSTSKTGSQDYKPGASQEGSFRLDGEKVIMNFGGEDVILNINRSPDGCINSLSNDNGIYEKK